MSATPAPATADASTAATAAETAAPANDYSSALSACAETDETWRQVRARPKGSTAQSLLFELANSEALAHASVKGRRKGARRSDKTAPLVRSRDDVLHARSVKVSGELRARAISADRGLVRARDAAAMRLLGRLLSSNTGATASKWLAHVAVARFAHAVSDTLRRTRRFRDTARKVRAASSITLFIREAADLCRNNAAADVLRRR